MSATPVNPVVPQPTITLASLLTPGEYVDEGGPAPSDLPSGVASGWHLVVENPGGATLMRQTLISIPTGSGSPPYPEVTLYIRYNAADPSKTGQDQQWT